MIVKNYTVIGFQCPYCGSIEKHTLRLFEYSDGSEHEVRCSSCGRAVVCIERVGSSKYRLTLSCVECGERHKYTLTTGELWASGAKELRCLQTDDTAMVIGSSEHVDKILEEEFYDIDYGDDDDDVADELARLLGTVGSTSDLLSVIEHFRELSDANKIECDCGERFIQLQIEEGGLRFCCPSCGRELFMDISTPEAIGEIMNMTELHL